MSLCDHEKQLRQCIQCCKKRARFAHCIDRSSLVLFPVGIGSERGMSTFAVGVFCRFRTVRVLLLDIRQIHQWRTEFRSCEHVREGRQVIADVFACACVTPLHYKALLSAKSTHEGD